MGLFISFATAIHRHPVFGISLVFLLWKLILLAVVHYVPTQYDKSSVLILLPDISESLQTRGLWPSSPLKNWLATSFIQTVQKLVVWDAVFFTKIADRGVYYEHELAFGQGWTGLIRFVTDVIVEYGNFPPALKSLVEEDATVRIYLYGTVSMIIANISHWLSALALYPLTKQVFSHKVSGLYTSPVLVSILYIMSPAAGFLLAGYSESTFALLSFLALLLRELALQPMVSGTGIRKLVAIQMYLVGALIFTACFYIRSNGILWGLIYICDILIAVMSGSFTLFFAALYCGIMMFLGTAYSQFTSYMALCPDRGVWCESTIPSVYLFLQNHYWDNGFFHYWTLNNIPNFLFALPVLTLLVCSSYYYVFKARFSYIIAPYIVIQMVYLVLCIFLWHVQIINRVSSCLPSIIWFAADVITNDAIQEVKSAKKDEKRNKKFRFRLSASGSVIGYFFTWSIVQTALLAAFLPPA